jgi:membrane protease YdiL (CAAX protease family)
MNPPFKSYPLALRIPLIFCMFFFNIGIVGLLAALAAKSIFGIENIFEVSGGNLSAPGSRDAFLFMQALSSLGGFALTAMMFSVLEAGEYKKHLRLATAPTFKLAAVAVVAVLAAQFFIEWLVKINQLIPAPAGFEAMQKQTAELTEALMNFKDVGHFIVVSIVVAVIPAIGEEFLFRGLLLGDMLKAKVRPQVAIPVTGFLFALVHGEFHNTLAIWVLGSFLGYLYYASGSLWLPILAHFTNNFLAVLLKYLFNTGVISKDLAEAETPLYATVISVVVFAGLLFILTKWKKPANFVEPEPEIEVPN